MTEFEALIAARKACRICVERSPGKIRSCAEFDFDPDVVSHWEQWLGHRNPKLLVVGQDFGNVGYFVRCRGRDEPNNKTNENLYRLLTAAGLSVRHPSQRDVFAPGFSDQLHFVHQRRRNEFAHSVELGGRLLRAASAAAHFISRSRRSSSAWGMPDGARCDGYSRCRMRRRQISRAAGSDWFGGDDTRVFAVGHCGPLGLINRPWPQQLSDWRRIGMAVSVCYAAGVRLRSGE